MDTHTSVTSCPEVDCSLTAGSMIRIEDPYPKFFREAVYPNGKSRIQQGTGWHAPDWSKAGITWKDLRGVCVDENGKADTDRD